MKERIKVCCKTCSKEEYLVPFKAKRYVYCSPGCMSKDYTKIKFRVGDRINNWKIIQELPVRKHGRTYVKVSCTCGSNISKDILIKHVEDQKHRGCEKCSRLYTSKGIGLISGEYWSLLKNGAEKRNIPFLITIEEAWSVFLKQKSKCSLTGMPIQFEPNCVHNYTSDNRKIRTASLDRIDSNLPYTIDNVQWVHKDVNIMKNKFEQQYFIQMCHLISKKHKLKNTL